MPSSIRLLITFIFRFPPSLPNPILYLIVIIFLTFIFYFVLSFFFITGQIVQIRQENFTIKKTEISEMSLTIPKIQILQ